MAKKEKVVFLSGKKVILRPLRKETDLKSALRWINDPEVIQYLTMFLPQIGHCSVHGEVHSLDYSGFTIKFDSRNCTDFQKKLPKK